MMRWILVAVLGAALAIAVACSEEPLDEVTPETSTDTVVVDNNEFSPRAIEVAAGTEVTWRFEDNKTHDAVGDGWGSEPMQSGEYSWTFDQPGTYDYRCTLHDNMTGRVIVTE